MTNPRLFVTGYGRRVPQPRLFVLEEALGESGWLKALKREEDAPHVPRGAEALQQALFPYLDAL